MPPYQGQSEGKFSGSGEASVEACHDAVDSFTGVAIAGSISTDVTYVCRDGTDNDMRRTRPKDTLVPVQSFMDTAAVIEL